MGNIFRSIFTKVNEDKRILMLGLDAAGKTTILYKLNLGEVISTIPTIGFNVETVKYKSINFNVYDVGGQDKIRLLWQHYYKNCNAIIFVIDSNDKERLYNENNDNTVYYEINKLLSEPLLNNLPLLIFANKQDLPNVMSVHQISKKLKLDKIKNRKWFIQGCCGTSGDGLYEGLDWLCDTLKNKN